MIKITLAVALILVCTPLLFGQATCKAPYTPVEGGYTICPGDALKLLRPGVFVNDLDRNRTTFVMLAGASNFKGTVSEAGFYWTKDFLNDTSQKSTVKDLGVIKTDSGSECSRMVTDSENGGKHRIIAYYFCPGTTLAFISAMSLNSSAADLDLADSIVKTFAIKK